MISDEKFAELEAEQEILARIAAQFAPSSPGSLTLRRASIALFFAMVHHSDTFEDFCSNFDQVLSDEQKQRLKALGLETDS
jgi:hypothetical protein